MNIPSIVIAGTNSGCGKTTISMGIMAALVKRGIRVQPFKVGPDYIDPMFHTFITGRPSRNLDSWLLDEETVKHLFIKNAVGAEMAVVEGVMGFYDGFGGKSIEGSTAHIAQITGAPVILVINAEAMSLSAAAIVKGFAEFDKNIGIKGVILNNISGESHFNIIKDAIENHTGIPVVGYLKRNRELAIESRHLGLITSSEIPELKEKVEKLSEQIEETIDLDLLLKLSRMSPDIKSNKTFDIAPVGNPRIAVAMDKAFNFYYRDNLDLLEMLGAELSFFSPISDTKLPDSIDGLYLGGGYPEVFAKELQDNLPMKEAIKRQIESGLPAYAECGGFMYLTDSITDKSGSEYMMTGVIPGKSHMTNSLKRFGYVYLQVTKDNLLGSKGSEIRAHEFHYSETNIDESIQTCLFVSKSRDTVTSKTWSCGYGMYNLLAGYPHIHFWSNIDFARNFAEKCTEYKNAD